MSRDMRDPGMCGLAYLSVRKGRSKSPIEVAVNIRVPDYRGGEFISNDPGKHHSQTPQTQGDLTA